MKGDADIMDNAKTDSRISNTSCENLAIISDCLSIAKGIDTMVNGEGREPEKDSKCGPDSIRTTVEFTRERALELLKLLDRIREGL